MRNEIVINRAHRVVSALESGGRTGQIANDVYLNVQPTGRTDRIVELVAVWNGAAELADPSTRCVVLRRNPNIRGQEKDVLLRVDQVDPRVGITRTEVRYREDAGAVLESGDPRNLATVDSVLRRIQSTLVSR